MNRLKHEVAERDRELAAQKPAALPDATSKQEVASAST